ncbi:hypothetical protein [Pseudoteredinibacter isoporae]|uniref:hypothetical protein n=1 Tax=Pseudoteredinibacter isoporae TaxID=570281 RepID=UPI00310C7EA5
MIKKIFETNGRRFHLGTLTFLVCTLVCSSSFSKGFVETPALNSPNSGISTISGWHCTSNDIEIYIDGKSFGQAGTGTLREDTAEVCGHSSTGFSLLVNYGAFEDGVHTLRVIADGETLETRTFFTTRIAGENVEYARGLKGDAVVHGFPEPGDQLSLYWVETLQNFVAGGLLKGNPDFSKQQTLEGINRTFLGIQRTYKHTGKPATDMNQVEVSYDVSETAFSMTLNDPELGECTLNGDVTFNFHKGLHSNGDYNCDNGREEGSYYTFLTIHSNVIDHLKFIYQLDASIRLKHPDFEGGRKNIVLIGLGE